MATVRWTGKGDGHDVADPDNWSKRRAPEPGDDVVVPGRFFNSCFSGHLPHLSSFTVLPLEVTMLPRKSRGKILRR